MTGEDKGRERSPDFSSPLFPPTPLLPLIPSSHSGQTNENWWGVDEVSVGVEWALWGGAGREVGEEGRGEAVPTFCKTETELNDEINN